MHWVGPSERDYALYVRLPAPQVPLAEAEAIVCTGLRDDRTETVEDYRDLIEEGVALQAAVRVRQSRPGGRRRRHAPALRRVPSPPSTSGAAARCSGPASRIPSAYATALERAGELRGEHAGARAHPRHRRCRAHRPRRRAQGSGVDGLLIAAGIHSDALLAEGDIDPAQSGRPVRPARHAAGRGGDDASALVSEEDARCPPAQRSTTPSCSISSPRCSTPGSCGTTLPAPRTRACAGARKYLEITYGCGAYRPYPALVEEAAVAAGYPASLAQQPGRPLA